MERREEEARRRRCGSRRRSSRRRWPSCTRARSGRRSATATSSRPRSSGSAICTRGPPRARGRTTGARCAIRHSSARNSSARTFARWSSTRPPRLLSGARKEPRRRVAPESGAPHQEPRDLPRLGGVAREVGGARVQLQLIQLGRAADEAEADGVNQQWRKCWSTPGRKETRTINDEVHDAAARLPAPPSPARRRRTRRRPRRRVRPLARPPRRVCVRAPAARVGITQVAVLERRMAEAESPTRWS